MVMVMVLVNLAMLVVSGSLGMTGGIMLFIWATGGDIKDSPQAMAPMFIVCLIIAALSGSNLIALWIADHK